MALDDTYNIVRPGQSNQAGGVRALHIEEFTGMVEGTVARASKLRPFIPVRSVRGTSVISNNAVGKATLQVLTPGTPLDGSSIDFAKKTLVIDTTVISRNVLPLLEDFQTQYNSRVEIAREQGQEMAKFIDESYFIQGIKAALQTESSYRNGGAAGKPEGHFGGSQQVLSSAGDALDPAKLYAALADLFVKMHQRDVDPLNDGVIVAVKPAEYFTLLQAEQLINTDYITSDGNSIKAMVHKAFGVPIVNSNNLPTGQVISSHKLGADFNGDFTKVVAVALSPRALLAGETIALTSDVFFDKKDKQHFIDSWTAYNVTTNRAEYAGVILKP